MDACLIKPIKNTHSQTLCLECGHEYQRLCAALYQKIADFPGISSEDLANQFMVSVDTIESICQSGALGSMASMVRGRCARCQETMASFGRTRFFCQDCAHQLEQAASPEISSQPKSRYLVDVPPLDVYQEAVRSAQIYFETKKQQDQLRKSQRRSTSRHRSYGLKRS